MTYSSLLLTFFAIFFTLSAEARTFPYRDLLANSMMQNYGQFQNASQDFENYCPGFNKSREHAKKCLTVLGTAMISCESGNFRPDTMFCESFDIVRGKNGRLVRKHRSVSQCNPKKLSVGYWALSLGECKAFGPNTIAALKNPKVNIPCGARILGKLVGKDQIVSGQGRRSVYFGAARYWGPMRRKEVRERYVKTNTRNYLKTENRSWSCWK